MGLVTLTFDRLTLILVCESHLGGEPSFQIWARYTPLCSCYVRDGRTDKSNAYCAPFPTAAGHKKYEDILTSELNFIRKQ